MESPGEHVESVDIGSSGVLELSSGAAAMTFSCVSLRSYRKINDVGMIEVFPQKKKKKAVEDRHPQVSSERKVMEREKDESCKSDGKEGRMMRVKKNRIYL